MATTSASTLSSHGNGPVQFTSPLLTDFGHHPEEQHAQRTLEDAARQDIESSNGSVDLGGHLGIDAGTSSSNDRSYRAGAGRRQMSNVPAKRTKQYGGQGGE